MLGDNFEKKFIWKISISVLKIIKVPLNSNTRDRQSFLNSSMFFDDAPLTVFQLLLEILIHPNGCTILKIQPLFSHRFIALSGGCCFTAAAATTATYAATATASAACTAATLLLLHPLLCA